MQIRYDSQSVNKRIFHDFSLTKQGWLQANLEVYNSTGMNAIGSCVIHHHTHKATQALTFNCERLNTESIAGCPIKNTLRIWLNLHV